MNWNVLKRKSVQERRRGLSTAKEKSVSKERALGAPGSFQDLQFQHDRGEGSLGICPLRLEQEYRQVRGGPVHKPRDYACHVHERKGQGLLQSGKNLLKKR